MRNKKIIENNLDYILESIKIRKSIDKHNPEIISKYDNIDWVEIIKMRDLISHHYFHINHEEIFNTCKNDLPQLKTVIEQIIKENKT